MLIPDIFRHLIQSVTWWSATCPFCQLMFQKEAWLICQTWQMSHVLIWPFTSFGMPLQGYPIATVDIYGTFASSKSQAAPESIIISSCQLIGCHTVWAGNYFTILIRREFHASINLFIINSTYNVLFWISMTIPDTVRPSPPQYRRPSPPQYY